MALARHTFANITANLSTLASRLASASCPTPPCPAPVVPLPRWHSPSTIATTQHLPNLHRSDLGCGSGGSLAASVQRCHQLAAVLPDPWASCFVSAHCAFKLCSFATEETEGETEHGADVMAGNQATEDDGNDTSR